MSLRLFCFPINNAATLPNRFPIHFLIEEEESLFFNQQTIRLIYGFMQTEIAHYAGDAKTIEAEDAGEREKTRSFWVPYGHRLQFQVRKIAKRGQIAVKEKEI